MQYLIVLLCSYILETQYIVEEYLSKFNMLFCYSLKLGSGLLQNDLSFMTDNTYKFFCICDSSGMDYISRVSCFGFHSPSLLSMDLASSKSLWMLYKRDTVREPDPFIPQPCNSAASPQCLLPTLNPTDFVLW